MRLILKVWWYSTDRSIWTLLTIQRFIDSITSVIIGNSFVQYCVVAASLISPWLLWWPPAESHYNIYDHSVVGYVSHAHSIVLLYSVGNKITTTTVFRHVIKNTSKLRIPGPLRGEPIGHLWVPLKRASNCENHFHVMMFTWQNRVYIPWHIHYIYQVLCIWLDSFSALPFGNRNSPAQWNRCWLIVGNCLDIYQHKIARQCVGRAFNMMTSSNENIFRVTGHLCGEFTGPRWIPHTKASDAELWCLLWSAPE